MTEEAADMLAMLISRHPSPALLADDSGRLIAASPAARALFPALARGRHIGQAIRHSAFQAAVDDLLAGRQDSGRMQFALSGNGGERRLLAADMVAAGTGRQRRLCVTISDRSAAERLSRARVNFVAAASHELRTPLAAILGLVETLAGPARDDPAAHARFLSLLEEQARRMRRLVDDLLDLSRLEMEETPAETEAVDLHALLSRLVRLNAERAKAAGLTLDLATKGEGPFLAAAHAGDLERIFQNLIDNAIVHAAGSGRLKIRLRRRGRKKAPPCLAVSFRDHGPGIARRHLPYLTEPFYRVPAHAGERAKTPDSKTSRSGTGLGLAIVARLLARNSGRLRIKSRPGWGSRFTVELPPHPAAGKDIPPQQKGASSAGPDDR
jgi:two-component system phosphate regulon sensor histidine kinase PhoR